MSKFKHWEREYEFRTMPDSEWKNQYYQELN